MSEAKLRVHDAQGKRLIVLDRPLFKIGRHRMADLQLRPVDVSREHAEIAWDGEQYVLRDVGSSQGTYVNGRRVLTHSLADGDRIRLGQNDVEIVFEEKTTSISELMDTASDVRNLGQMAAILNGLRALGSGRVLAEVLAVVLDAALDVTKAERGFIMLANERGELEFKTARGVGRATLPGSSFATSRQIPREVFSTDRAQLLTDLTETAGWPRFHARGRHSPRDVCAVARRVPGRGSVVRECPSRSRRAVPGWPGAEHDAFVRGAVCPRGLCHAGRARDRKRPSLRRGCGEGARRSGSVPRRRNPTVAAGGAGVQRQSASIWRPPPSRAERSAAISTTIWSWPMAAWRSPWATSPERARRRRSWRRWFKATSSHRPQSALTRDRPRLASTPRCCVARSRHVLPRCSTACSPRMDV